MDFLREKEPNMPNYVYTTIELPSVEDAQKVWDAMSSAADGGEIEYFDFNKLIPMPETLDIEDGTVTTDAIAIALFSGEPRFKHAHDVFVQYLDQRGFAHADSVWNAYLGEAWRNVHTPRVEIREIEYNGLEPEMAASIAKDFARVGNERKADAKRIAKAESMIDVYASNLVNYGHVTWFEWCNENWNTKWNACESEKSGRFITFSTAWSAPIPVFEKLVSRFADIPMDIYWYEEQGIEYVGEMTSDGDGNAWLYMGARDKIAAAVYAKCNDGEDIRFYDDGVLTRDNFEWDAEYYIEKLGYPPFDEMPEIPSIDNIAEKFGEKVEIPVEKQ